MIKRSSFLVQLIILSTITALLWVGFETYRAFTDKPAPVVPAEISLKFDPTIDTESLDKIQKRIHLSESEIGDTVLTIKEEEIVNEEIPI